MLPPTFTELMNLEEGLTVEDKLATAVEGSVHSASFFRNEEMQLQELKKQKVVEPLMILV